MASLKEQALLERIGQLTVSYEDRIADLRVELTNVSQELINLREAPVSPDVPLIPAASEVLEGTVVQ